MRRQFVKAASAAKMLNAFETKLSAMKGVETATDVECSNMLGLSPEEERKLWEIDDRYEGDVADEDVPRIIAQIHKDIMNELGVDARTAKRAMVDILGFNPDDIIVEASTAVNASATYDLFVYHEDGYDNYIDTNGIFTGVPDSNVSVAELKNYWNEFYDQDPTLYEEYESDQGEKWLRDTLSHMEQVVEDSTEVTAAENDYQPFMLMEYSSGGPETGIEGDDFYCWGKFFAKDEADAKRQLERAKRKFKDWNFADVYVSEYNDAFDDGYEVYDSLDTLIQRSVDAHKGFEEYDDNGELIFNSTEVKCSYDRDKVREIANRYVGSSPLSGDWNTETAHEQKAIADELGVSMNEAKQIMIDELGFDADMFDGTGFQLTDDQKKLVWDIATNYTGSSPLSGKWEDETAHEQQAIADALGISLADAKQVMIDELGFDPDLAGGMEEDHWAEDVNSCDNVPVQGGLFDTYFGKEQADKYGDLICEHLKGKTVSKRKDLAEQPGGLIYEAEMLGIDMWDLLEALEGLCYQGRAMEIDDSTYRVKGGAK